MITIAIQCHNFQRRLCWMLSSLAQQTRPDRVRVRIDHMAGNGKPTTEALLERFASSISIEAHAWRDIDIFQYRGIVRNHQMAACSTEWIMFGDCDMVYHPEYFESLMHILSEDHAKATYMISSGRTSNPKELTNILVDSSLAVIGQEVQESFAKANILPKIRKGNVGAGFSQIVNIKHAAHGGYYVKASENRDWNWSQRGSNPKSDMQFRKRLSRLGGPRLPLPEWYSENAIHLNHNRDPEAGRHIEEQR